MTLRSFIGSQITPAAGNYPGLVEVWPNTDPQSPDIRCGRNASIAWNKPLTATISAGDVVGFAAGEPMLEVTLSGALPILD